MTKKPKGTSAAVVIILRQNPHMSSKQLANLLNLSFRRINQIKHDFDHLLQDEEAPFQFSIRER